jgi:Ca-activated chloride channel family protein
MEKRALCVTLLIFLGIAAFGINVSLAQIDASRLLLTQQVNLYVSVTDDSGQPVEGLPQQDFRVSESPDGRRFQEIPKLSGFEPRAGATEGITFLLLIDNSGSMYDTLAGNPTTDVAAMRITQVKEAVRTFLASMTNPRDRVGLASFNTFYRLDTRPTQDKEAVAGYLANIQRPPPEDAYTELYASLTLAARDFAGIGGRKAIIVLTDGENYPFALYSGKPSPAFGPKIYQYTEPIQACQQEGVTVYAIDFATAGEPRLQDIAVQTGGKVFKATDRQELVNVYRSIHEQVAEEYLLTYRATMAPAERKYVRVQVFAPQGQAAATRFYFASTVFGLPLARLSWLLLIPIAAAGLLLWLLTLLKLERRPGPASLEVLQTRVGSASTRVVPLTTTKTVIGGSTRANLTIAGAPGVREQHATVLYDPKNKSYTVVGSGEITVNNQPVKTKVLEPGDVIDVGGTTIVFDEGGQGEEQEEKKK